MARAGPAWRPSRWSLRARLVAGLLGLLFLLATAVGAVTAVALRGFLLQRLDTQLAAAAQRSYVGLGGQPKRHGGAPGSGRRGGLGPDDVLNAPGFGPGTLVAVHASRGGLTGRVVSEGPTASPLDVLPDSSLAPLASVPVDGAPRTVAVGPLGHFRVVSRTAVDGDVIITGLPLAGVSDTLLRLALIEVAVIGVGLVAAGLAGTLIVRRSLRPLRRVAATAGRVSELPLDRGEVALAERVPEADTDPRTEVGQVGAALNRLLGHVGAALQARHESETRVRRFVADASHELRTPLASIRGYAELTRRSREPVPADVARALARVESESLRMTSLVEDLLLLARLDSAAAGDEGRPITFEPVDLTALVVDAVSDAHAAGPDHRWQVNLPEEPVVVRGDPARLHQVVSNLLANARTHTPPGTHVTASLHAGAEGTATLAVGDDGPGIPAALLPTVFERFARGDTSRSRQAGSTGLGLAIVGAVVAAHGGAVDVRSRPGQTAFQVRLPLEKHPPAAPPARAAPVPVTAGTLAP